MAEVLDETDEERRLREEQEALLEMQQLMASKIAPPDPQLPQEAIPAENVGFTNAADGQIQIDTPEGFAPPFNRQMIGDERYNQELARAQRGSGFLAPDVGPGGNVITPGYDPAVAEASKMREQAKLASQAERFMGVQGYQQSINSGATPAEALALWGPKMYAQDTNAYRAQVLKPLQSSLRPEVTNVDGVKMYRTGPNSFAQARPEVAAKPPPETVAGQKILTGQITDARNDLERAEKRAADEPDANSVNAAIRARSKLRGLEENFMRGSTNWMKDAAVAAAAPKADEVVRRTKDGKSAVYDAKTKAFIRFAN